MQNFIKLEEKIIVSRQMINEALDRSGKLKMPENNLVELIQINGFLDLALRNDLQKLNGSEKERIENMIGRLEEILNSFKTKKSYNHLKNKL
jgi:hypothetical protein